MPQFFLNKKLIVLLISIIILVALIGFSLKEKENVSWPEQFVKDTAGFFQQIFHAPAQFIAGSFEDLRNLQKTYEENEKLKARLDEYVQLKGQVQELKNDNEELRAILDKKDDLSKYSPIHATVIGRNPDRWQENIQINKGTHHGVEKNMAVITSKGLIGKVKSTTSLHSTVQLVTSMDPKHRISAQVQIGKNKAFGFIEGYDTKKKRLLLKKIDTDVKVKKGSVVTTSGLGLVFPKGLQIGTVESVKVDQYGLTQTAYVKPFADLGDIENVMVVNPALDKNPDKSEVNVEEGGL
ncbi:rod shape-determining protein MreC [Bacillus testis]|uniref:rod shape-determining protein MreC n=1 Tax=Bacillus testis TaxID=1622072 RepID=UPI00067E6683|nr:rod shape-determining protein MreC [Bacillus testis]